MNILIVIYFIVHVALACPGEKDEVLILPGLRIQPTFKHFSGYLNGSNTRKLHYWFVESQNNVSADPLVLWMNGGPGCSSVLGLLTEHGPFRMTNGGYLEYNPYSWNKIANVLYLESPACVGFSYSTDGKCDASDDSTSLLNYNALKDFFVKFPQYKTRQFYITGESYGGFYVPTLAERIVLSKEVPYIQLKGILIGNAYSSTTINWNGNLHFAYNHGLISDRLWMNIISTCCHNIDPLHCEILTSNDEMCKKLVANATILYSSINPYNIYSECSALSSSKNSVWNILKVPSNYDRVRIMMGLVDENDNRLFKLRQEYLILKTFHEVFQTKEVHDDIPCLSDNVTANYLNSQLVKYALHIPAGLQRWSECSPTIKYSTTYLNMDRQYKTFFNLKDFRIWLFNGDVDMMCSYLSEEWYFERFNRSVLNSRKPWMFVDQDNSSQIGGYVKIWDRFSLVTVRGAGHMVPTDRPIPALHVFDSFLKGTQL